MSLLLCSVWPWRPSPRLRKLDKESWAFVTAEEGKMVQVTLLDGTAGWIEAKAIK